MKKTLTDEQLATIGISLSTQLKEAAGLWEFSMECMNVSSPERKSICIAGRKTQDAYHKMRDVAVRRWSGKRSEWSVDEIFTVQSYYTFV